MGGTQEETQEELMERVNKMSPEELLEFQKSRCIFCQIITGKVQSKKVYEDEYVVAVLDINPANPGHILLMPKEHHSIMPQVPEEVLAHLFIVAKKLSQVALKAIGAKGTNILIQNGIAAGQKAQHFMVHLIPRKDNDGLKLNIERKTISDSDYNTVKEKLTKRINEIFGIKEEPAKIEKAIKDEGISNEALIPEGEALIQDAEIIEETEETEEHDPKITRKIGNIEEANEAIDNLNEEIEELNEEVKEDIKDEQREIKKEEYNQKKEKPTKKASKEQKKKTEKKKKEKEEKTPEEKEEEKGKEIVEDNGVDLDDIARLIG